MWHLLTVVCLTFVASVEPSSPVKVTVETPVQQVVPGETVNIDVVFDIAEGWHIYATDPGDIGKPTQIDLQLPPGFTAGEPHWPPAQKFEESGFKTNGYAQRVVVSYQITVPSTASGSVPITVKASWLACHDSCRPGKAEATVVLNVVATPSVVSGSSSSFTGLAYYLLMGVLGGMLLNLMPCVLPVVSLKILSFARQAGDDRKRILRLALAYAAGTLATFFLLSLVVIALQQFGVAVGWGFHFQSPLFVIGMASVVALMALSMFGVFHIAVYAGTAQLGNLSAKEGWKGAFFTGVLATLLSTPCTAPFLGTALSFAFTQHWLVIVSIFLSIGVGLSAPYVVLSWQPAWLKLLPKPGEWMVRFKEAMGFAMLLTVVWLLSVLVAQCGASALLPAMLWLVTLAFCSWLVGSFAPPHATTKQRRIVWLLTIALAVGAGWFFVPASVQRATAIAGATTAGVTAHGEAYSPEALQRHLDAGRVVLLDFTAQWCLTCQVYEQTVLASAEVQGAMQANNAVVLRCDWTDGDPAITKLLQEFQRSGVPLYVVYSPHRPKSPHVLPDLLTRALVVEALEAARQP
jgi:thiol:disulfide interchange protein